MSLGWWGRIVAIARNTVLEAAHLRVVYVVAGASLLLLTVVAHLPKFTLSIYDDLKMLKDLAMATASLCGVLVAVFSAVHVITSEIDNWTVVTILSKPVRRWEFVVGKFAGLLAVATALFAVLTVLFTLVVWWGMWTSIVDYQGVYPELKRNFRTVAWQAADQMWRGMLLSYLQVVVLTGVAVACCVRVPMIISVVVFFMMFVAGHFVGGVSTAIQGGGTTLGKWAAVVLDSVIADLEALNVSEQVGAGWLATAGVLGWGVLYAAIYSAAALGAGILLFRSREVA